MNIIFIALFFKRTKNKDVNTLTHTHLSLCLCVVFIVVFVKKIFNVSIYFD